MPVRMSMLHVHASLCFMSLLHDPPPCSRLDDAFYVACLCCISLLHVLSAYPCCLFLMHVRAICLWSTFMLHVYTACLCLHAALSTLRAHATCPCWMSSCPCCMSMLHDHPVYHTACLCFMNTLHGQVSILHVHNADRSMTKQSAYFFYLTSFDDIITDFCPARVK
jgi:hypothetical protein